MTTDPAFGTVFNALRCTHARDHEGVAREVVEALRNEGILPPLPKPTPLSTVVAALDSLGHYPSDSNAQAILMALSDAGFPAHPHRKLSRVGATKAAREALRAQGISVSLADAVKVADAVLAGAER